MKQWQYTFAHCVPGEDPVDEIKKLGREGWEVCAYEQPNKIHEGVFFLKREFVKAEAAS